MPHAVANQEKLDMVAQAVVANLNATAELRSDSEKAFNYAENGSWDWNRTLQDDLTARGLPILRLPILLPRFLSMFGYMRRNVGEIAAIPNQRAGGYDSVIANRGFQWIAANSDLKFQHEIMAAHAWIGQLGGWSKTYFRKRQKLDKLGRGPFIEILTEAVNPFAVGHSLEVPDYENTKKGRFVFMSWWATPEQILAQWELTEEQQEEAKNVFGPMRENSLRQAVSQIINWWSSTEGARASIDDEMWMTKENMVRVIQFEERVPKKRMYGWHRFKGEVIQAKDLGMMAELSRSGYGMVVQEYDEIWVHTTLGNYMLLDSRPATVQNGMFSIIPMGAYNFSGRNFGLGIKMVGPQEMVERSLSAQMSIIGRSATRALWVTKNSMDPEQLAHLEANYSAAGFIGIINQGFQPPQPVDNSQPSIGQSYLTDAGLRFADEISSRFPETRGDEKSAGQPGVVFQQKREGSDNTIEPLMAKIERTQRMEGEYQLALMQAKLKVGDVLAIAGEEVGGKRMLEEAVVDKSLFDDWQISITQGEGGKAQMQLEAEQKLALLNIVAPEERSMLITSVIGSLPWHDKAEILEKLNQHEAALVPPQQRQALQDALRAAEQPALPGGAEGLPAGAEEPLQLEAGGGF